MRLRWVFTVQTAVILPKNTFTLSEVALAEVLGERVLIISFLQFHQGVPSGLMVTIWAGVSKVLSSLALSIFLFLFV